MITGFFKDNRGSETAGYTIKKYGTVFSYMFDGFDDGLPVKVANLVKNDPDEFHFNYDHENYTEVFRFDKNVNLTLINAWVSDKGTREDNYKFPDIFEKVRRMGHTILKNYDGFDGRQDAYTMDFSSREKTIGRRTGKAERIKFSMETKM